MEKLKTKQILNLWEKLHEPEKKTLLLFAEFLAKNARHGEVDNKKQTVLQPVPTQKPKKESAVAALKRLKNTYPMIEADLSLLDAASQLLMQKVFLKPDAEIISEMERLFADRYNAWRITQQTVHVGSSPHPDHESRKA